MNINPKISIHRFHDRVALSIANNGETVYLDRELAERLAHVLNVYACDIRNTSFSASTLGSREVSVPVATVKLPSIVDPAFTEAMTELRGAEPLPWHVVSVSFNTGSFGHKGVVLLRESGEAVECHVQAYGGDPVPKRGDVLVALPHSEVPRASWPLLHGLRN